MGKEIIFGLPGLEIAVRKMVGKNEGLLTKEDVEKIKYLRIEVSSDTIELSTVKPPIPFIDFRGGEEWEYCCAYKHDMNDFIDNNYKVINHQRNGLPEIDYKMNLDFEKTIVEFDERGVSKQERLKAREEQSKINDLYFKMTRERCQQLQDQYRNSVKELTPEVRRILELQAMNEISALRKQNQPAEEEIEYVGFYDWIEENPGKFEEELSLLKGLEVLRICEAGVENFEFLIGLKNLKVLELAQMAVPNRDFMKKVGKNLEQLCVWSN